MDDLISRKAAIEALALNTDYQTPEGIKNDLINHPGKECDWLGGIDEAISIIEKFPSISAVPLEPLCLLLHDIVGCPCYTQPGEDMCNRLIGDQCNTEWDDVECWKRFLTKWMEELDAAD